ncbi:MAG: hypothetical protein HOJ35_06430 [Bdellovibrionales bacterium]|nr:hypothetical protein [Bdellovibrionales bacterium]
MSTNDRPYSILFVIGPDTSSLSERNIISLAAQNENNGGLNYLYSGQGLNSFHKLSIDKIKIIMLEASHLNQFQEIMLIYKEIQKRKIDLVHSFTLRNIIGLSLTVRQFPRIPLFLSLDSLKQLNETSRALKRIRVRLDKIIVMDQELIPIILKKMLAHPGKFELAVPDIVTNISQKEKTDKLTIGTYLKNSSKISEKLGGLFNSIDIIKLNNKINLELVIFVDQGILDNGIGNEKKYFIKRMDKIDIGNIHLWFSNESDFLIDDFSLQAIVNSIPVLGARNSTLKKLLARDEMSGETFNPKNNAEMRSKLELIVTNFETYKTLALSTAKNIKNSRLFQRSIFSIYRLAILRRNRLIIKK